MLPREGSPGGPEAQAHPPPALATGSTPQAVTWSQSVALWGQGWVKIAWAGTSQLPLKTRHPWVHVDPPLQGRGKSGHRPNLPLVRRAMAVGPDQQWNLLCVWPVNTLEIWNRPGS